MNIKLNTCLSITTAFVSVDCLLHALALMKRHNLTIKNVHKGR